MFYFCLYFSKKDEEIKRFMLDEDLSETKRAQTIIMKGVPKQKIAVRNSLKESYIQILLDC